jgi:hypothetical protein
VAPRLREQAATARAWGRGTKRFLVRRWRAAVAVAAAAVLVAVGGVVISVRAEASRLMNQADARHADGDCQDATETLDGLGPLHRLVAGDVVDSSAQGRRACAVLLDAATADGHFELDGIDDYLGHPGARWAHAGVVRAELLFKSPSVSWESSGRDPEAAVEQLVETLAVHPEESASVRNLMSTYVERFEKDWFIKPTEYPGLSGYSEPLDEESLASDACAAREEYLWLHDGGWTEPELAEPIASTDDHGDDLLAGCAQVTQADGKLTAARSLYEEYLETYADAPGAKSVRKARDELVESIQHKRMRDRAAANADDPADGSNLDACGDARCQVRVTSGTLVPIGGPGGPYELLVSVTGGSIEVQLGGFIQSFSTNGGSIVSGDGYASWGGEPGGELTLNNKVAVGVDGVSGGQVTLSVWRVN